MVRSNKREENNKEERRYLRREKIRIEDDICKLEEEEKV